MVIYGHVQRGKHLSYTNSQLRSDKVTDILPSFSTHLGKGILFVVYLVTPFLYLFILHLCAF